MRLFNKVAIVGVGLIGGSIALALKKKGLAGKVIGVSRHKKSLALARNCGAIDYGSQDLRIIKEADLLILATPVRIIMEQAPLISKIISPGCVVTDVGSTKEEIVSKLEKIFPNFIGSHPLAGSEKRGVANASGKIFERSLCILTPTARTRRAVKEKVSRLWSKLGCQVHYLSAADHDKALSFISHIPHVAAFSLIASVPSRYLKLASNSLRDTTRISSSDALLWSDIFLSNRKNILSSFKQLEKSLRRLKTAIRKNDSKSLIRALKEANRKRKSLR